jgi:fucose permease
MNRAAISSYLSILAYGMCITIIGPALGAVGKTFALSPAQLGLFTTALSAGLLPAVLLGGNLVDRYGARVVGVAGQASLTAGLALFSVTSSFPVALLAFFMMGIGGGSIEILTNTVMSELYPHKRASALNLLHAFFGIGALVGPLLSGGLIDAGIAWENAYRILAAFSAGVIFLVATASFPARAAAVVSDKVDFSDFLAIVRTPVAFLFGAVLIVYVGCEMGITYWSVLYLTQRHSLSILLAGSFLSYFWVAITVGRFVVFFTARKIGDRLMLLILTVLALLSYALFLTAGQGWVSGVGLTLVGLFFSGIFPTALGLGVNRFAHVPGTITGFMMTFMAGGMLIFPYVVGLITNVSSLSMGMLFILLLLACLTVLTALLALRRSVVDGSPGAPPAR